MTKDLYSPNFDAPVATRAIAATVELPGSKSLTNRELVLALAMQQAGDGFSELSGPLLKQALGRDEAELFRAVVEVFLRANQQRVFCVGRDLVELFLPFSSTSSHT